MEIEPDYVVFRNRNIKATPSMNEIINKMCISLSKFRFTVDWRKWKKLSMKQICPLIQ